MSDVLDAKAKVRALAEELDTRSRELADTNRALGPVQEAYEDFIRDFEAGLYEAHEADGKPLPAKDLRMTLALKEMPVKFRGQHRELLSKRDRLKQRISDLKAEVDAWRSVLSADKVEMEAIS